MKVNKLANLLLASGISALFVTSCANVRQPAGGPRDTIPPTLVNSVPQVGSVNYRGKKFVLTFDEYTQAKNLKTKLLITPQTDVRYQFRTKKKSLIIEFEEPLKENTTYTFNFQDAIQDINENNPWKNAVFAFSTGDYIDSLKINGTVRDVLTGAPVKEATVALFDIKDTLDIYTGKPEYFAKTDEEGHYNLSHIRHGKFKAYAYLDENNNLINEPKSEPAGLYPDTLSLDTDRDSLHFNLILADAQPFKMNSAKENGKYFDVLFNKYVKSYQLSFKNDDQLMLSTFSPEHNGVRFFNATQIPENDSIPTQIIATDTVGNKVVENFHVKFADGTKRKYAVLEQEVQKYANDNPIQDTLIEKIQFSKPIRVVHPDSMMVIYDSLNFIRLDIDKDLSWNKRFDEVTIKKAIKLDSIFLPPADTLFLDSLKADSIYIQQPEARTFTDMKLHIPHGAFISIESDTAQAIDEKFTLANKENLGSIEGTITTDYKNYQIQLVTADFKVVKTTTADKNGHYSFYNLKPATYKIRVLIDENGNGQWDIGNILKNEAPEPVFFFQDEVAIRANWELTNIDFKM
ncbi:Ig-like domain-containing protein [Persicobacter psychrovividus]|uniref:SbsA Ig-like domain-containing protein n=1 Tax=Persicobacter psychrovividus TaxID=387638 RepID=A0ABN6L4A2_9BACT|nr:hypothetical protein PEPS_00060 [Persicobacter psychrovividus]